MQLTATANRPTTSTPTQPAPSIDEVRAGRDALRLGDRGPAVELVQQELIAAGFLGKGQATGTFDARTEAAVRTFQGAKGLKVDGVVGPKTLGRIAAPTDKAKDPTPSYTTQGGTQIRAVPNDYAPKTTPQLVRANDPKLQRFLETQSTRAETNTDPAAARREVEAWTQKHPEVLKELGIKDVHALSPKQAIALSQRIATDAVDWPAGNKPLGPEKAVDGMGLEEALAARRASGKGSEGACRNFAELTHVSFETLKAMQDPATTQLRNTYAVDNSGGGHRTTGFVTIEPGGHAVATIADAAWNEGRAKLVDYTATTAHNDPSRSVRWSYLMRNIADGVGDPSRSAFRDRFDNGAGGAANDGKITQAEVTRAGGTAALSRTLDAMEPWHRGRMAELLTPEVMIALNAHRGALGQKELSPTSGANNLLYHGAGVRNVEQRDLEWKQKYAKLR